MYRNILVPVDVAEPSSWSKSIPTAAELCKCFGASLALVTVLPTLELIGRAEWSPIALREMIESTRARLAALSGEFALPQVDYHVETGSIYAGILAVAERTSADLIVLASHRPAMKDYLIGANAARVVRHARCSVFVVRE